MLVLLLVLLLVFRCTLYVISSFHYDRIKTVIGGWKYVQSEPYAAKNGFKLIMSTLYLVSLAHCAFVEFKLFVFCVVVINASVYKSVVNII